MTTKPHAQLGDRNSVRGGTHEHEWVTPRSAFWVCTKLVRGKMCSKPAVVRCADLSCEENEDLTGRCRRHTDKKPTPPKRGKGGRWTTTCDPDGWTIVAAFDGDRVSIHDVVRALNRHGVVLPARRERG